MSSIFGYAASIISVLTAFIGIPMQIKENFLRRSCEGLSLTLYVMWFLGYSIWSAYGFSTSDNFLAYSQLPGAILCFVILIQFKIYKSKN